MPPLKKNTENAAPSSGAPLAVQSERSSPVLVHIPEESDNSMPELVDSTASPESEEREESDGSWDEPRVAHQMTAYQTIHAATRAEAAWAAARASNSRPDAFLSNAELLEVQRQRRRWRELRGKDKGDGKGMKGKDKGKGKLTEGKGKRNGDMLTGSKSTGKGKSAKSTLV